MNLRKASIPARGLILGDRIEEATTFGERLRGLMFRPQLEKGEGLLLREVSSIHMCFMRFPIDAVFLRSDGKVVAVRRNLPPWTGLASAAADDVLELPAGSAAEVVVGDQVLWE